MNNATSALKGFILGLAILICSYGWAGGIYPPQGGGSGSSADLATVLAAGNTTGGTDIAVGALDEINFGGNAGGPYGRIEGNASSGLHVYGVDGSVHVVNDHGVRVLLSGGAGDTNGNGGSIELNPGAGNGSGVDGVVRVYGAGAPTNISELSVTADNVLQTDSDLVPDADSTRDLGSSSAAWAEVHADDVYVTGAGPGTTSRVSFTTSTANPTYLEVNGNGVISLYASGAGTAFRSDYNAGFALRDTRWLAFADNPSSGTAQTTLFEVSDGVVGFGRGAKTTIGAASLRELVPGATTSSLDNDGSATHVFSVVTGDGDMAGIEIGYTLRSSDGSTHQAEKGRVQFALVDASGGVTASGAGETSVQAVPSGTLTTSWTVTTTDDQSIEINLTAQSSLTVTTHEVTWWVERSDNVTITVP